MALCANVAQGQSRYYRQIQIGNFSNYGSNNLVPVLRNNSHSYIQNHYPLERFNVVGWIDTLWFYCNQVSSTALDTSFTVWLGKDDDTLVSGTTDWVAASQLTQVYHTSNWAASATGWIPIPLQTPGTSNLVVAISRHTTDAYSNVNTKFRYNTVNNTALGTTSSNYSSGNHPGTSAGGRYNQRAVLRISFTEDSTLCYPVRNLAVDSVWGSNVRLRWNRYGQANQWEVAFSADDSSHSGHIFATDTAATIGNLHGGHIYSFTVRPVCDTADSGIFCSPVSVEIITCPAPHNLTVSTTTNAAQLSWQGAASTYRVDYSGSDGLSGSLTTSNTSCQLTGLTSHTTYTFSVRAICGADDTSFAATCTAATAFAPGFTPTRIQIGTLSTTKSQFVPFCAWYKHSWTETIYPTNLLGVAGYIDTLWYHAATVGGLSILSLLDTSCTIYLGTTSRSAHNGTCTDFEPMSSLTQVFRTTSTVEPADTGWFAIPLDTPFFLNDTSNLVVVVSHHGSTYSSNWQYSTNTMQNSTLQTYNDTQVSAGSHPGTTIGNASNDRPVIRLSVLVPGASCPRPDSLATDSLGSSFIAFSWTAADSANSYMVSYGEGTASQSIVVAATHCTLSGLNPSTTYRIEVRSMCDSNETSIPSVMDVTTLCGSLSLPYVENFDSYEFNAAVPCWSAFGQYGYANRVTQGAYDARSGKGMMLFSNYHDPYSHPNDCYDAAVLPPIDLSQHSASQCEVSFWAKGAAGRTIYAGVSSLPGNGTDLTAFTPLDSVSIPDTNFHRYHLSLANDTSNGAFIVLAVWHVANDPISSQSNFYIDDLEVNVVSCPRPRGLACDIMGDDVRLHWNPRYGYSGYEVAVDTLGTAPDSAAIRASVADTAYILSGLAAGGVYDAYVRTRCDNTHHSLWFGPIQVYPGRYSQHPGTDTLRTCNMVIYDHCGPDGSIAYTDADCSTIVLPSTPGNQITFSGSYCNGGIFNYLKIYDGAGTQGTLLVNLEGEQNNVAFGPITSTLGAITIESHTEGWGYYNTTPSPGFAISVACNPCNCFGVSSLSVSQIDSASARITWTDNNDSARYNVAYGLAGSFNLSNPSTYTLVQNISARSLFVSRLAPSTQYKAAVRVICSDDSTLWSEPVLFTTTCSPIPHSALPYSEGFEDYAATYYNRSIDPCWYASTGLRVVDGDWVVHTGSRAIQISYNNWVSLPRFEDNLNHLKITFWAKGTNASLRVGVMSNAEDSSSFELVQSFPLTDTYTQYVAYLSNYSGFQGRPTLFTLGSFCQVDDITVDTCLCQPTSCNQVAYGVRCTSYDTASATIVWQGSGSAYQLRCESSNPNEPVRFATTEQNEYTFSNLQLGTRYLVSVRAICSAGDTGYFSAPIAFRTRCTGGAMQVPYFEDFNNPNNEFPSCWDFYYGGDSLYLSSHIYLETEPGVAFEGNSLALSHSQSYSPWAVLPQMALPLQNLRIGLRCAAYNTMNSYLVVAAIAGPEDSASIIRLDSILLVPRQYNYFEHCFANDLQLDPAANYRIALSFSHTMMGMFHMLIDSVVVDTCASALIASTLWASVNDTAMGRVLINGSPANRYDGLYGDTVTLQADACQGYQFLNWSDGATNPARTVVLLNINTYLTANFAPATATLWALANDSVMGRVLINGSPANRYDGLYGDTVLLQAQAADPQYQFLRWDDGDTHSRRSIILRQNETILIAQFAPVQGIVSAAQQPWSMTLTPNPCTSGFTLALSGSTPLPATIEIYSMQGLLLQRQPLSQTRSEVSIANLPAGVYLVRIVSPNGTATCRVVKQ